MPSIAGDVTPAHVVSTLTDAPSVADVVTPVDETISVREEVLSTPWRCRLGFHRWMPLALSLHGARGSLGISLCRCCPAVRRPV